MSSVRGSTKASMVLPFTFMETCDLAMVLPPDRQPRARALARASARVSMTPAILVRYCAGPRASVAGAVIASAAATARFTVAASSAEPIRIFAASCAHSGVSPTLVSPIEQVADFAAAHGQHHGGRGGRIIADLALEFFVSPAVSGRRAPECARR